MAHAKKYYADRWKNSSGHFYKNGAYEWMCSQIEQFDTILEIGCGTGESTLSLIEHGHTVIAVEKNEYCIEKAKELIKSKGYIYGEVEDNPIKCDVVFVFGDISEEKCLDKLLGIAVDVVICWNVGSYWDDPMRREYFQKFLNDDFSYEQIIEDEESTYAEFSQWKSLDIAKYLNAPMHFIDRDTTPIKSFNDTYYTELNEKYGYLTIKYNNEKFTYFSSDGIPLNIRNKGSEEPILEMFLLSILLSN